MTKRFGIRWRIALVAAIVTIQLLSIVGTLGYLAAIRATRQSQIDLLDDRIAAAEAQLSVDGPRLVSQAELDTSLIVVEAGAELPFEVPGTLRVVRNSLHPDVEAVVGIVSTRQVDATFRSIRIGLWVSILATGFIVGLVAWGVVDRSLRPVRALTQRARSIEGDLSAPLLDVGETGDELEDLAATFNDMISRLRIADMDRRRFVSDASHELRTPLMVLSSEADYALRSGRTDEFATSVQVQTQRLTSLTDDLLSLAAFDEGRPIGDGIVTVRHLIDDCGASDLIDPGAEHLDDEIHDISHAISNLVTNARRHCDRRVEISVERDSSRRLIHIFVDDDGPGIPAEARDDVFRRFTRLDHDRNRSGGGAGLGLAIAQADVRRAGGTLSIVDSPLGGARLSVTMPLLT